MAVKQIDPLTNVSNETYTFDEAFKASLEYFVITSYSIHYTKLYELFVRWFVLMDVRSKNMQRVVLVFLMVIFFTSCGNEVKVPEEFPDKYELACVLTDLYLLEATFNSRNNFV